MIWDRIDDAFDDEQYGTLGELQSDIERLERELAAKGIRVPAWTPPWVGQPFYSVQARRVALYGRKLDLEELVKRKG